MRTFIDCIPCFVRQALDAVRLATDDPAVHERVLREVLREAADLDLREPPPEMGRRIHGLIRRLTGRDDPYASAKRRFTDAALRLHPELARRVAGSADPLATAVRLAIAGNVIDMGVRSDLEESHLHEAVERALDAPLIGSVEDLRRAVDGAERILFLADNAGELVFDRLLIEQWPPGRTTVAVRGAPVINDATRADAEAAGLADLVEVIDNGSDAPGTVLAHCDDAFRRRFADADLLVAKGQGNYETLSETDKDIFFILQAKCPVIARDLGCEVGSLLLRRGGRAPAGAAETRAAGLAEKDP